MKYVNDRGIVYEKGDWITNGIGNFGKIEQITDNIAVGTWDNGVEMAINLDLREVRKVTKEEMNI